MLLIPKVESGEKKVYNLPVIFGEGVFFLAYEALYTKGRPKTLAQLVGQEHISSAMTRAVLSGRLSHAYLLVGTRGTGKTSTARLLAKAMNCETVRKAVEAGETLSAKDIPCNKCPSCLSISSSPDNVEFDAASNRSVEDVTRLLSTAYLAPLQSRVKTFIIDEVHMLSFEAVNSILKLIEEPPPNVAFFLATTELQKVPMTIRSRCQVLNFRLIPTEIIAPYLVKVAKRLKVELPEDAAKKIARLAEGSMRDALTYLDQCYAMSDNIITLDDVNQTLGLISDADLDEIISAVKSQDRFAISNAITHAFRSGLNSISIAEALITRLRDLEFQSLSERTSYGLHEIEKVIEVLRKTILEMQGSGIPDIILEMSLMNFASPIHYEKNSNSEISEPPKSEKLKDVVESLSTLGNTLDDGKKIFYHILETPKLDTSMKALLNNGATVKDYDGKNLTLIFQTKIVSELFERKFKTDFALSATKIAGHNVKVSVECDENLPDRYFYGVSSKDADFLEETKKIFQAAKIFNCSEDEEEFLT